MATRPPAHAASAGAEDESTWALPRSVIVLLGLAATVGVAAGVKLGAEIVAPTMLALLLTVAVLPARTWALRHRWPSSVATLFALILSYLILVVLVFGTVLCIIRLVELLPQYTDRAQDLTNQTRKSLSGVGLDNSATATALEQLDPAKVTRRLTSVLTGALGFLGNLFFLVTLMFFFVTAAPGFGARMTALARSKPAIAGSLTTFVKATQRYLVVTAVFGGIVAVLDAGALWLLAVPLPLVWGFFSFLTNFIPNIGFVLGIIPPTLLALLEDGPQQALLVILVYSVLNVTIQTFIQPRYVGATVGLSAEMTFMSLVVWAFLLGPLGAVLAVPMTLLVRALFLDADTRAAWAIPLIATSAEPEPLALPAQSAGLASDSPSDSPNGDDAGRRTRGINDPEAEPELQS
jgi:predicted PurR-regulated permease PerM